MCKSEAGVVILCWSPDDSCLLSSAVDNEVRQYTAVDGRLNLHFDIERTGRTDNFTRAYYMCGGDSIVSGSSEEHVVRIHCASTGEMLSCTDMHPDRHSRALYVVARGCIHSTTSLA